ncbi:MAG: oligoribonuclease [Gammaproteobacteria bacterium]|nr:oligoribonuclease [Gammaproteobacteria bacterium]
MNNENLIWIDLEMTGLDTARDNIIEIATVVTDKELVILAEGPVFAIYQSDETLSRMDKWNQRHHGDSGLLERVRSSQVTLAQAEQATLDFLRQYVPESASPMCGNSICQDRRFLYREMPRLECYFHYRNLDVSSIKELIKRWRPELLTNLTKAGKHIALDDVKDSIHELTYYRKHFFR